MPASAQAGPPSLSTTPVCGAVDGNAQLLGFATYGVFRAWPAYKYSVEHSVYVRASERRTRIGLALMQRLIERAIEQQYHVLVGVIDESNAPSFALHRKLGFVHVGTIQQAGFKFGRWLDVALYQLILSSPAQPVDG